MALNRLDVPLGGGRGVVVRLNQGQKGPLVEREWVVELIKTGNPKIIVGT